MPSLTLNLTKPGDVVQKLALNLSKGDRFKVRLAWDGDTDLDLHALVAVNLGNGAGSKVSSLEDLLSCYNVKRMIRGEESGYLQLAADKTFSVHGGALVHSPDAVDGHAEGDDEYVTIRPDSLAKPASGYVEIPLVATIHPQNTGKRFRDVKNAHVYVEDANGKLLLDVSLSAQFGDFVGVQMGSIMIDANGSNFAAVGSGFNGDFNSVLAEFS
ncbi:TerD family protein [Comamonas thiooxydans]|uniref:TerD family protein n=1 Tax=Comamonas thiooxydans TaxID=363952 RepID=UPI001557B627|nr:TerD family protein [Comamonas thiooxydans]